MTLSELMDALDVRGIRLAVRLVVDAPSGSITPEIRRSLADHKSAIITRLANRDTRRPCPTGPPRICQRTR